MRQRRMDPSAPAGSRASLGGAEQSGRSVTGRILQPGRRVPHAEMKSLRMQFSSEALCHHNDGDLQLLANCPLDSSRNISWRLLSSDRLTADAPLAAWYLCVGWKEHLRSNNILIRHAYFMCCGSYFLQPESPRWHLLLFGCRRRISANQLPFPAQITAHV